MVTSGPLLALIDGDFSRRKRLERLAWAMGVRGANPATPEQRPTLVLLVDDISSAGIAAARALHPGARIIAGGVSRAQEDAVAAFRAGADDFVWMGAGDAELAEVLFRHLDACAPEPAHADDHGLIGTSAPILNLRAFVRRLAPTSATVLITGETGTGKDVATIMIHRLSRRAANPMVALNCAAIPDALIEGELFGYERGAFSGAYTAYPGKLKLADSGTLLLDEIAELSLAGQAKLLRAIETREVWRLGARTPTPFDIRIIAATNRDLAAEVRAGRFREDLFYRLAVSQLRMPPLRERTEDIFPLACHLLAQLADEQGCAPFALSACAIERLKRHGWPGNVRELRNALEVASISTSGLTLRAEDFPASIGRHAPVPQAVPDDERSRVVTALDDSGGNKSLAAQRLNCSRMTLYRRMQRLGISEAPGVTL